MRKQHGAAITNTIDKACRKQIDQKLDHKIECDQQGDLCQWNPIARLKGQKQQWYVIIYNRLYNISNITAVHCVLKSHFCLPHNIFS